MKIALINTFEATGGAARAAKRLFQGLRATGADCTMLVAKRDTDDDGVQTLSAPTPEEEERARALDAAIRAEQAPYPVLNVPGFVLFHGDRTMVGESLVRDLDGMDVINLHWVRGLLDYGRFFARYRDRPVVWTLHDMHPFTGGCHYPDSCEGFTEQCGACPFLGSVEPEDISHAILARKKQSLTPLPERLHIVAPSRWMAEKARRSALFRDLPISVIPNGLNTNAFRPMDRIAARRKLGLPENRRLILFIAHYLNETRKGLAQLNAALSELPAEMPVTLVLVGEAPAGVASLGLQPGVPWMHLGSIDDDAVVAELYSAVDVVAVPSLEDNLPNTVLEAMACGTPVIGFTAGGIPDMIAQGGTGFHVPAGDHTAFARALVDVLAVPDRAIEMGRSARLRVEREYTLAMQTQRYMELYRSLLDRPVPMNQIGHAASRRRHPA